MSAIKMLRKRAGLTQSALATKLGVRQSTVAMWENGSNSPQSSILVSLAGALNCTIEEILIPSEKCETDNQNGEE